MSKVSVLIDILTTARENLNLRRTDLNHNLKRIPTSPSVDSFSIHSNEESNDNFYEFEIDDLQSRLIDVEVDTMKIKTDI